MPKINRTPRGKETVYLTIHVVSSENNFGENFVFMTGMLGDDAPDILSIESDNDLHIIQVQFNNGPSHRLGKEKLAGMLGRFLKAKRISKATLSTNQVVIS
jgi:hypothetical protein